MPVDSASERTRFHRSESDTSFADTRRARITRGIMGMSMASMPPSHSYSDVSHAGLESEIVPATARSRVYRPSLSVSSLASPSSTLAPGSGLPSSVVIRPVNTTGSSRNSILPPSGYVSIWYSKGWNPGAVTASPIGSFTHSMSLIPPSAAPTGRPSATTADGIAPRSSAASTTTSMIGAPNSGGTTASPGRTPPTPPHAPRTSAPAIMGMKRCFLMVSHRDSRVRCAPKGYRPVATLIGW